MIKRSMVLAVSMTALLISSSSNAAMSDVPGPSLAAPPPPRSSNNGEWVAQVGAVGGGGFGGLAVGSTFLVRESFLVYGANVEWSGFLANRFAGAGNVGIALRHEGFGLDLLGQLGVHRYTGVGRELLSSDPGASATLPFAGGRARAFYEIGRGKVRFQIGLSGTLERDLSQATKTYSYSGSDWFSGSTSAQTVTHAVGFTTKGLMLDLGGAFDL